MKVKITVFVIIILIVSSITLLYAKKSDDRHRDYVPDEETATKIAEVIWVRIYGQTIYNEKPFIVHLNDNGVWTVSGNLPSGDEGVGGVAHIEIQKYDCEILKVYHTR